MLEGGRLSMSRRVIAANQVDLILDSGAFSAWMKQTEINIDEYIDFCLANEEYISYIVNLDVIPGKWGQKVVGDKELNESAQKGWDNYHYLIAKGIPREKIIHVFHQGESFDWLLTIINEVPYIGLSPANDRTTQEKMTWLDQCMQYVLDKDGLPKVKFHGFGVTSFDLMFRYPWYSVDSTSWVMTGRFGSIFVPKYRQGKYSYLESPLKICVSNQSPDIKDAGQHFSNLAPMEQAVILDYLKSKKIKLGRSTYKVVDNKKYKLQKNERFAGQLEIDSWLFQNKQSTLQGVLVEQIIEAGVSNDYRLRDEVNIMYYLDLEKHFPPWPWPFQSHRKSQIKGFGLT
jgi:hypothetical protein